MATKELTYRSPLFYVGDKYKLYPKISKYFPENIKRFIEPFTGGGSVFLNVEAESYLLNDIDTNVINIHKYLIKSSINPELFFKKAFKVIKEYNLSHSFTSDIVPQELKDEFKKTYYAKFNKEGFNKLKDEFNSSEKKDVLKLYILLIYGFNRMLRFNSLGKYNLPVGNVDFNRNTEKALRDYFYLVSKKKLELYNLDFIKFLSQITFQEDDFVYVDPPYLITFSEYNKLWNEEMEIKLLNYLDFLNSNNVKFAVSNVTNYKGKENKIFTEWCKKYNIYDIKSNYISYHDNTNKDFKEVLITNFNTTNNLVQLSLL